VMLFLQTLRGSLLQVLVTTYHIIHHHSINYIIDMQSEPYRCNLCEMIFVNSEELTKHKTVVHINKMYQCQSCNKFFANKQEFEKHTIKVHSEKNQYNDFSSDLPASTEEEEGRI
jgi:uncharacterized C2H2 Zn-finger protein